MTLGVACVSTGVRTLWILLESGGKKIQLWRRKRVTRTEIFVLSLDSILTLGLAELHFQFVSEALSPWLNAEPRIRMCVTAYLRPPRLNGVFVNYVIYTFTFPSHCHYFLLSSAHILTSFHHSSVPLCTARYFTHRQLVSFYTSSSAFVSRMVIWPLARVTKIAFVFLYSSFVLRV
jgi:hypothetical protein